MKSVETGMVKLHYCLVDGKSDYCLIFGKMSQMKINDEMMENGQ
jgi:hypothetical protein